jgi:hypothetical protein
MYFNPFYSSFSIKKRERKKKKKTHSRSTPFAQLAEIKRVKKITLFNPSFIQLSPSFTPL